MLGRDTLASELRGLNNALQIIVVKYFAPIVLTFHLDFTDSKLFPRVIQSEK